MTWSTYAAPPRFHALAGRLVPWLAAAAALFAAAGLWMGFFVAPTDAQQGEVYRILFIHVPSAWMSMLIYMVMAAWSALGWMLNVRTADMLARALAPTGALFTVMALVSGALWGVPTWGTWWVWDARLTSELVLLFLYLGCIALGEAFDDPRRGDRAAALLAIVGVVNVPIIYFSVRWWNTLHQGASISLDAAPKMAGTMLAGLLLMTLACWAYAMAVSLARARAIVLEREADAAWARAHVARKEAG
jgi:heme exporter protein C